MAWLRQVVLVGALLVGAACDDRSSAPVLDGAVVDGPATDIGVDVARPKDGQPADVIEDFQPTPDASTDSAADGAVADGAATQTSPIWLVHLSDVHIGASAQTSRALDVAVRQVVPVISPTATIVTGDITEGGGSSQWAAYRTVIQGAVPAYPTYFEIPGNHDFKDSGGKAFLTGSQTGLAKGGFYGMTYPGKSGARVRVVRTNTADHSISLNRLLGFFGAAQKTKLLSLPAPAFAVDHTVVAGHHPMQGLQGLQILGTDKNLKEIFTRFKAAVYLCGHVHSAFLSWINTTLVVQAPTLGKASVINPTNGYMLVGLDTTGPSVRTVSLGKGSTVKPGWPLVLVTTPADAVLGKTNPVAKPMKAGTTNVPLRALAFSAKGVTAVQAKIDGGSWISLTKATKQLWQTTITAPTAKGKHTLEVRATSPEGSDTHKVTFNVTL